MTSAIPAAPWLDVMFSIELSMTSPAVLGVSAVRLSINGCVADSPISPRIETRAISAGNIARTP